MNRLSPRQHLPPCLHPSAAPRRHWTKGHWTVQRPHLMRVPRQLPLQPRAPPAALLPLLAARPGVLAPPAVDRGTVHSHHDTITEPLKIRN